MWGNHNKNIQLVSGQQQGKHIFDLLCSDCTDSEADIAILEIVLGSCSVEGGKNTDAQFWAGQTSTAMCRCEEGVTKVLTV